MPGIYQISARKPTLNIVEFEVSLGEFSDWVRLSPYTWIVYTSKLNANGIYNELRSAFSVDDQIFVCKLDVSEYQGWMPQWVWTWIVERQSKMRLNQLSHDLTSPPNPLLGDLS